MLESLEEESGDEALEQNYEPTAALHWNCQENNTWLQERGIILACFSIVLQADRKSFSAV